MDVAGSAPRKGNSHLLSTHHYQLTAASCTAVQRTSSHCCAILVSLLSLSALCSLSYSACTVFSLFSVPDSFNPDLPVIVQRRYGEPSCKRPPLRSLATPSDTSL
jgi:hypothetical protein